MSIGNAKLALANPEYVGGLRRRFWKRVSMSAECWEWRGFVGTGGYGQINVGGSNGSPIATHRVSYFLHHGVMPELCVLHRCDNRLCVRPEHLFLGTRHDNIVDMFEKGRNRHRRGEAHPRARLDEESVRDIRRRYNDNGERARDIAADYGMHFSTIINIAKRRIWRHVA